MDFSLEARRLILVRHPSYLTYSESFKLALMLRRKLKLTILQILACFPVQILPQVSQAAICHPFTGCCGALTMLIGACLENGSRTTKYIELHP